MGNYNDIYMRAYLGDPGNVPRSSAYPLSASPDVIPYGTSPANPSTFLTDSSWGQAYNATLVVNQSNYLYMRAQNLGTQATTGTFSLFYSQASLLLWPSLWSDNQLKTQTGANTQDVLINAGQKGVTPSAFVWNPASPPPGDHYCLVGMVSTPSHPATPPPDGSIQNFATWISQNGSFAWHNVSVTDSGSPTWTKKINYDQGGTTDDVYFQLVCKNVPVGSKVAFSSGTAGPNPPINLPQTTVTSSTSFITGMQSNVPGTFVSDISYSYWAASSAPPPSGFDITMQASVPTSSNSALYKHSKTLQEMGVPTPEDYLERMRAVKKWETLPWSDHESYADQLLKQHQTAGTYAKNKIGPIKFFVVGTDTMYAQTVSTK